MKNNELKEKDGEKIRRQFFNGTILNILVVLFYVCYLVLMAELLNGKFSILIERGRVCTTERNSN